MAVRPRPWRRSALVGRALPGLALPGRRRESPAEVGFDGFVFDAFVFVAEDRAEAGMVDPNAESRAAPRDGTDPFASVKGTGARFPSAVCLLMPDGSNDLGACDGCIDGSESRIRKMRFEDKAVDFLGKKWLAGCAVLDIGTDRGSSHLWCGAPRGSRGGRSLGARWIRSGHSPHIVEREPELSLMHLRFVVTSRARSIVAPARPAYAGVRPEARCGVPARRRERARPGLGAG